MLLGLRVLATVILYSFLGVAFYIIWRDLRQLESQTASQIQTTTYQLRVVAAAEGQSLAVGEILPLQPVTVLGRVAENALGVDGNSTSAAQARLRREDGIWWLEDLGNGGGTLLNDSLLAQPMPLNEGDIIGIGSLQFKVERSNV